MSGVFAIMVRPFVGDRQKWPSVLSVHRSTKDWRHSLYARKTKIWKSTRFAAIPHADSVPNGGAPSANHRGSAAVGPTLHLSAATHPTKYSPLVLCFLNQKQWKEEEETAHPPPSSRDHCLSKKHPHPLWPSMFQHQRRQ